MASKKWMRIGMLAVGLALIGALGFSVAAFAAGPGPYGSGNADAPRMELGSGADFIDEDGDGVCDNWVDEDGDGFNDNAPRYGTGKQHRWVDEDGDGVNDNATQDGTGKQLKRGGGRRGQ